MRHSLHLGLNCVDPSAYGGWFGLLCACENDATGLATALAPFGFSTKLLLTANCTIENFLAEVHALQRSAKPGDDVIISYSGHGGQQRAIGEMDGLDETLCLYDGQFVDDDFVELLAGFKAGVNFVVILDCCHSGGMNRGAFKPAIRVAPQSVWKTRTTPRRTRGKIPGSGALFCASAESETASDGDKFGAWTGALLASIHPSFDVAQWFMESAATCPQGQHPVLRPLGEVGVLTRPIEI